MECTLQVFLEVAVMFACVTSTWGQICPLRKQAVTTFRVHVLRDHNGLWISQVRLDGRQDGQSVTSISATGLELTTGFCNGTEKVQLAGTLTAPPPPAGPDYELHPGVGYYKLHSERKTWHEAREVCALEGAHLAIVNSEKESRVLQSMFAPVAARLKVEWAFIGFHDLYTEGQYLTIFDDPLKASGFYRWSHEGQPDNYGGTATLEGEDCGSVNTNGGLNDISCTITVPFFCEQELWLEPRAEITTTLKCMDSSGKEKFQDSFLEA